MKTIQITLSLFVTQVSLLAGPADAPSEDFAAHEWGTFTSVQGADGVQFEWNPFVVWELPSFVYDANRPDPGSTQAPFAVLAAKTALLARQRMETPVIYFYSDRERKVDVSVDFPQGTITEWFPQAARPRGPLGPGSDERDRAGQSAGLRWDQVEVLPRASGPSASPRLASDSSGSHYYAARAVDANVLRVTSGRAPARLDEHERFLFYRGVGSFTAPLQVTLDASESALTLRNTGTEELTHLYVLKLARGFGKSIHHERLAPGEQRVVSLEPGQSLRPVSEVQAEIRRATRQSLVAEGLFEREASAMVETWNESWFGEDGLRVLYILPRSWTDRVLPLTIRPAPRQLVRVMVGRAEMITPSMEWQVLRLVAQNDGSDPTTRAQAVAELRRFGRFAEPTVLRVLGTTPSPQLSRTAWELLHEAKELTGQGSRKIAER